MLGSFFTLATRLIILSLLIVELQRVYSWQYELERTFKIENVIEYPTTYKMDISNFNVALKISTSDQELIDDFRRFFRVILLFEKN